MMNEKIENSLNLALTIPEKEREKTDYLKIGYNTEKHQWTLLIQYAGDLNQILKSDVSIQAISLLGNYAVITIDEEYIEQLANRPEIIYIEKPNMIQFQMQYGRIGACIHPAQNMPYELTGKGVLAGIIDTGIDWQHNDFKSVNGQSRIIGVWDQNETGQPPEGYTEGNYWTKEVLNNAKPVTETRIYAVHGTAVAGIIGGNGSVSAGKNRGIATNCEMMVVVLKRNEQTGYSNTVYMIQAVDFLVREAMKQNKPLVINISYGHNEGAHDGQSLLENYLNDVAKMWKMNIVIAAGNDGEGNQHQSVNLYSNERRHVEWVVDSYTKQCNIQLWRYAMDELSVKIKSPSGAMTETFGYKPGTKYFQLHKQKLWIETGMPAPYQAAYEVYVTIISSDEEIETGIWEMEIQSGQVKYGQLEIWISQGMMLEPSVSNTVTIPGTCQNAITVGAYNAKTGYYAAFSGRGYNSAFGRIKPDLVAPGVDILTTSVNHSYSSFTGTSFAAPFVTGAAILMMEYGIVEGKAPYLYGEQLKMFILGGTKPVNGIEEYPDIKVGYGRLCLADSIKLIEEI